MTGGAANIRNIDKAFTRDTKFEKIRFVRSIRIPLRTPDYPGLNNDGDCNAAIALIDKGEINCCGGTLGQPDLFDEPKDTEPEPSAEELAAAEAKKKAEEAEAQRKAEEEARIKAEIEERERERKEREEAKKKRRNKWKNSWKRMSNFFGNLVKEDSDA